jgi:hypothetical protein
MQRATLVELAQKYRHTHKRHRTASLSMDLAKESSIVLVASVRRICGAGGGVGGRSSHAYALSGGVP